MKTGIRHLVLLMCLSGCATDGPTVWLAKTKDQPTLALIKELEARARLYPEQPDWEMLALQARFNLEGISGRLCGGLQDLEGMNTSVVSPIDVHLCLYKLADAEKKERRFSDAVRWYERIDLDRLSGPRRLAASSFLFRFYVGHNDWQKAQQYGLIAMSEAPADADLHQTMGMVLESRGELRPALAEYELALSLNPELSVADSRAIRLRGRIDAQGISREREVRSMAVSATSDNGVHMEEWHPQLSLQRLEVGVRTRWVTDAVQLEQVTLVPPSGMKEAEMEKILVELLAEAAGCGYGGAGIPAYLGTNGVVELRAKENPPAIQCLQRRLRTAVRPELLGGSASFKVRFNRSDTRPAR